MRLTLSIALWLGLCLPAAALDCEKVTHADNRFTLCSVDLHTDDLRLFLYDENGAPYGHFTALDAALRPKGETLAFAMNAGMYHADRSPVGYYRANGKQEQNLMSRAGPGNFGLLPNGVLCLRGKAPTARADVIETLAFKAEKPNCRFATQSGPMLVINGALHPKFLAQSTSRYIRNGVGTSADGKTAIFAISDNSVNFYTFATLFRDRLKTPNALYFDGNISRLHAPLLSRSDPGFRLGPMIGVVVPLPN